MESIVVNGSHRHEIGVNYSTFGVDIIPIGSTPSGELVRVYYYPDSPSAAALDCLKSIFRSSEPIFINRGELVGVLKDGEE